MQLKIMIFIMLLSYQLTAGAQVNVAINPETPVAGETINVLAYTNIGEKSEDSAYESLVTIQDNNIKVFISFQTLINIGPPPPFPRPPSGLYPWARINGLDEGIYNLEYYRLGWSDDFPPLPADYPLYFVEEIQFEVRGTLEPTAVNATSFVGIMTLILLMFSFSLLFFNRR